MNRLKNWLASLEIGDWIFVVIGKAPLIVKPSRSREFRDWSPCLSEEGGEAGFRLCADTLALACSGLFGGYVGEDLFVCLNSYPP